MAQWLIVDEYKGKAVCVLLNQYLEPVIDFNVGEPCGWYLTLGCPGNTPVLAGQCYYVGAPIKSYISLDDRWLVNDYHYSGNADIISVGRGE